MPFYEYEGKNPQIDETSFIHPQAVIIGDVRIGQHCYVGAGAILRGDYGTIIIENGSNIQENSVLHSEPETVAHIGADVLIGHAAIVHGPCTLHNNVVIGMGAIVSTHCVMEEGSFLAAGSVLPPRRIIPSRQLAMGNPAKAVRETTEEMVQYNLISVKLYQDLAQRCKTGLKLID